MKKIMMLCLLSIFFFHGSAFSSVLFSDDFNDGVLAPWEIALGTWTDTGTVLQGSSLVANQYSFAFYDAPWTDYTVQGEIQIPALSFGGGIGGRVDPATGAHYGAWVYPQGSLVGPNVLKLWKFPNWTGIGPSSIPMQQVSLPDDVGTGTHTLKMTFIGNRILVYYDGELKIDKTDDDTVVGDAYLSGGISADFADVLGSAGFLGIDNITVESTTTPTAITLASFDAKPGNSKVALIWTTGDETDNLGFNIYRAESKDGEYVKINGSLIATKVGSGLGASYEFTDSDVKNQKAYYYKLEDVDINGVKTMHGPVKAVPRLIYGLGK
jgi:hypothetical protein